MGSQTHFNLYIISPLTPSLDTSLLVLEPALQSPQLGDFLGFLQLQSLARNQWRIFNLMTFYAATAGVQQVIKELRLVPVLLFVIKIQLLFFSLNYHCKNIWGRFAICICKLLINVHKCLFYDSTVSHLPYFYVSNGSEFEINHSKQAPLRALCKSLTTNKNLQVMKPK